MSYSNNPITDIVNHTVEATRVDTGGSVVSTLSPAAVKGRRAGTVSSGGTWQPYGRVGITPINQFAVAK